MAAVSCARAFEPASYCPGLVPSTDPSYKVCASVTLACSAVLSAGVGAGVEESFLQEARTSINDKLNNTSFRKKALLIFGNSIIYLIFVVKKRSCLFY